jgi:hypothetical protein
MFPCSHGNISFLQNGKEVRKLKKNVISKKRVVYVRGDIRRFYIWFNIHLIDEYHKLKEPKVLGTFGGEQLIETLACKESMMKKTWRFFKTLGRFIECKV